MSWAEQAERTTLIPADRTAEETLLLAVNEYLRNIGWTVLVASVDRLHEYRSGERELVIKFSGVRND